MDWNENRTSLLANVGKLASLTPDTVKGYAIASAEAMLGEQRGRVMMVRHGDDTTSVVWAPDNHGKKPTNRRDYSRRVVS